MPDKKYLIEIPGMPEGSGVWDADKWERNKDIFMEDYPDANVFELGEYDAEDAKETDQIMLDLGIEEMSGTWDNAKWERNKDVFMQDHPEAKVSRVRYVDYWGQKAEQNRAQKALLQQPNEERNAKLAELGYYDDITGGQVDFSFNAPSVIGLKPLSSAVETTATGETTYHDPRVKEFFANDTAETDRQAEMARLDAEYDANPSVIAQREWEAQMLAERKAYAGKLEEQIKKDMESEVDAKHAGLGAAAKYSNDPYGVNQMTQAIRMIKGEDVSKDVTELEKQERYTSALKFLEKAKIARDVAGKGMGGAIIDWAKEGFMDAGTQSDIEAYNEIGDILTRLEKELGNLKDENLSEEVFDKYLTKDEQALIKAFYEYNLAMAEAQQDMSRAYKGGKIFAASIPFMLEFLVTGGVYRAAGRAATTGLGKHFAKWIAKTAAKTFARKAAVATTKVVSGAIKAGVGTLARTVASPGTYKRMAEASIEIDKEGHLNRAKDSAVAFADMYVENLSEISGGLIGKGLGILGKGAGKLIAKTPLSKIGGLIGDNKFMQTLSKGMKDFMPKMEVLGFHGLPEEIGEEFIGNAIREVAHIQPGALKEMIADDNFGAMLIGFAPMTLIGVAGGAISLGVVNAKAAKMGEDLREMFGNTYSAAELDHMMGVIQNAQTAEEIQRALKPYAMAIANAEAEGKISADEAAEQIEMLYQYGGFMAQNNALVFGKKAQDRQMMDAKREEFTSQYGRFWQEDQNETVQIATLNNGSTVFVTSAPAADGMIAIVDAMTGKKGFANVSDILTQEVEGEEVKASNSMTMDAFLNSHIATQRKTAEETRMNNERNAQIEALAAQITPGTRINVGTEGSPVYVFAKRTNKNGVVVVDETGMESMLGWEQAADYLGKPIIVETDQQKLDAEISARLQRLAERHARRKPSPAVQATEEAAEGAAEVVAQEQTHIPLNEDGTVNEAAFWTQDPEGYVKWNDEQNKDGGQDSLRQIAISKQELIKMLNEVAAGQNTSNPTMRKAAEKQAAAIAEKIAKLQALEMSYADALAEEKEAIKQTQATPTATMSEEDLVKMDEQYQSILGKTRIQSERVRVMQEYLDKLAEGSIAAIVLTRQNYLQKMQEAGCADHLIEVVKEQVEAGEQVGGFMAAGKVFLMADSLSSIEEARITYVHERQHVLNKSKAQLLNDVASLLGSKEAALAILKTFVGPRLSAYENDDMYALADEIVSRCMEVAYTTEEFSVDLQLRGIPLEVISIVTEIDNEQRQDQSLSHARRRSGRNSHADVSGAGSVRQDGRDSEQVSGGVLEQEETRPSEAGERGNEARSTGEGAEVISENNAVPFRIVGEPEDNLSNETKQELADKGLVMEGGVIMSGNYAELKHETGYLTPIEEGATTDDVRFAVVTMPGWKQNYLKYQDAEERVVRVLEAFADRITANELVNGVVAQGKHKSSKKTKDGRLVSSGPLRSNISYVVTFDLDTSCPRTFQYLNYVKRIERRIGRPLTQIECIQLNEMMRMYGQQIPCVYCYAENKRQAMKQYFNNYIESRHAVLTAETNEEALKHMYGHEAEGTDPKTVLTEAAYKVFVKWRKNPKGTYNPTMRVLWHQYDQARNSVLSLLDMKYAEGSINTDAADETLSKIIAGELGVSNKTAIKAIEEIVVEWKWNTIEGQEHDDFTRMDEDDLWANENALEVWRDMTLYAKSASGAKNVNRYVPYTDELKNVDQATRDYINGMGGLRMHSTNDFRIDYVFDYFQFLADMAAAKMFGHTYTKSPEFVRIFGNSGYKINMSIAAYQDENGVIRPNVDEGFDWNEAKELRRLFPHAGTMLMATSDEQLQMALDSEWIDMCIPFHHSGLPKAVWYNMRLWTDYTTVQNERYFNNDERIAMLAEAGVELPKKISTENVEEIFNEHFGIKVLYGKSGKRVKPHFLPGPTIVDGVDIPGHNNDHKRYLELCKEYGVKPRFEGIKVKDNTPEGGGRIVDITEHPRYMILVKETARTDTPQTAIQFNFDQPSEALGGKTPMDYAFDELEARAMAESDLAGGKVKDIYTSLKQDQFGIVDQFLNTIIKHKEETGEDYPMDYLTPESREWFLVQRKAFEEAFKDIETIPYHRNEYDEQGNLTKGKGLEREEPIDLVAEAEKAYENDVMMRVIGEQAAQRLDNSRKANAMMGALETAKQMADAGKDAKAIKMATGWEKAADGLWRYEQPDFEIKAKHGRQKTFQLKRLISDKSLFTEYPILNDVKVVYMQLPAGERGRVIHVNGKPEIQVSIDAHKEQNPVISKAIYDFTKNHADIAQILGQTMDMGSLTPEQKKVVMDELGKLFLTNQPFTDKVGGKDILVHEIQHIIQAEEGFALGGNDQMLDTTDPKVRAMVDYFIKEVEAAEQEMQRLRDEARDLARRAAEARRVGDKVTERAIHARASQMNSEYTQQQNRIVYLEDRLSRVRRLGMEGYKKLAGEVEARNVADRIYLSEEERRNTLLSETEDVVREDQIFLRNNVMMKADEYKASQGVSFRISPEQDKAYMEAVKKGHLDIAQKMIDEAARAAGYDSPKLYHGTQRFGFTVIDPSKSDDRLSFFATESPAIARTYSSVGGERKVHEAPNDEQKAERTAMWEEQADEILLEYTQKLMNWLNIEARGLDIEEFGDKATSMVYGIVEKAKEDKIEPLQLLGRLAKGYDELLEEYYDKENYKSVEEQVLNDNGVWDDRLGVIEAYAAYLREWNNSERGNYALYAKTQGMLVVECNGSHWNDIKSKDIPDKDYSTSVMGRPWKTRGVARYAKEQGYKGVIFKNIVDPGGRASVAPSERVATIYDFFEPQQQVKSADPVTYDNEGNIVPLSERFNPENPDIRFRFTPRTEEQRAQLFDAAKTKYGTTNNFNATGYMLPDGSLLDFSEANDGGDPNSRSLDHRDVEGIIMDEGREYELRYNYVTDFVAEGAIRMLPEYAGFQLSVPPTKEQRSKLMDYIYKHNGEVIMEITDQNGSPRVYMEYNKRTSPSRIFKDMDEFFNNGTTPGLPPLRFRVSNENQAIFVSNAAKAVEGIKMEKATPEQWLKMVEKNGGLKAGEDKWMGLSDWLKASDKKTLTKDEVMQFINDNMIVIEEQHYGFLDPDEVEEAAMDNLIAKYGQDFVDRFFGPAFIYEEGFRGPYIVINDPIEAKDLYYEETGNELRLTSDGELTYPDQAALIKWAETVVRDAEHIGDVRSTERRRRHYVTNGLDNYHEIALTVPNIDPWKTEDVTHFGDAGNGRAVVWTRFGETTLPNGEKVLVVDEVQSKRHDAGRKQGYADIRVQKSIDEAKKEWEQKEKELEEYKTSLDEKYGVPTTLKSPNATKEEIKQLKQLRAEAKVAREKWFDTRYQKGAHGIPDAPFEKNWLEVGMKRMLRYAAENGFDYVAWTNGEQQRERYSLAKLITSIGVNVPTMSTGRSVSLHYRGDEGPDFFFMEVDENGKIKNGQAKGRTLSEVVGKEVADQIMAVEDSAMIESKDIRVGGEGLADLYDKMLPSFMNKYGKKWGVKVEDLELPNLGKSGYTMHSVPVTEEMKASVMEGQVMFRTTAITPEVQEEMDAISASAIVRGNYLKAPNGADTNLTPEQWAMVRTKAFKAWFGDWEKAARINKLRNSEPVVMTGNEFEGKYELNRDSAQKYILDELRDTYTIADTKERIKIVKKGAKKVTSHSMGNDAHIRSIAIIPEIIKSAIFITEMPADKTDAQYDSYRYYVCGLEYAGESYTVKMTVGVKNGDYYYDHTLTDIEKGKLLDMIESQQGVSREGFTPTENESEPSYALSDIKDKKLVSILQTNSSKVVDANGEPKVVYHGSNWRPLLEEPGKAQFFMQEGAMGKGAYFSDLYNEAEDYARLKYALHNDGEYVDSDFIYDNGYVTEAFLNIRNEEDILETYTQTYFVARNPSQIKSAIANTGEFSEENGDIRFRTSMELDQEFGAAWRDQQNEDGRHSTQVANTKSTYEKIGNWMKGAGLEGASILDASSGLGLGTQALREMGFQVDDVEPFPSENREAPTFASYDAIDGKYDVVISNAVLNVIPDDWRADVLHKMAAVVKDGGKIIINTRPASNISKQGVEGKTRITLDSPSEILVKRGDRIAAYQKGFTSEELASWIESELGEGWRVEKATKKNSGISGEGTAVVVKENEPRFRITGTPTENVVAEGVILSKKDLANLAGDIFAALPEESRKKITDDLKGNILGLQDAILQIPTSLATKESWSDEDKAVAAVIRAAIQDLVDANPTSRPLTTKEALWMLYNSTNTVKDLVDAASRAFVAHRLGFDPASMQRKQEVDNYIRFRTAANSAIDAATDMYNYETSLWTERLKESWLDMNQSVKSLQEALAQVSGMPVEPWENIVFALNQLSSKSYADKKKYLRDFLIPLWDAVMEIVKVDGKSIEEIERYMMLKHGLERNKKFATRDAKDFYRTMYDLVAERMKNQSHAQQVVALSEAKKKLADIDAQIAVASSSQLPRLNEARARAQYDVNVADLVLRGDEKQNETELQAYYDAIDNGADPKYREFREKDYGGLTSMFVDTTEVQRSKYKSEEAYQKAVLAATTPKFTKVADMEAEAQAEVDYFEKVVGAKNLWDKVNAATKETLRHQYESGMITIEQYEAVRDMFDFYVPLRGFADNTAEDMYSYYMNNSAGGFTKPILGAKGRKTRAESPLGWIGTMAESAIQSDNKNQAKMALYYMTLRRPDQNLLTITETWYEYTGQKDANGKKIFKAAYPPATDRALNADELRQHMEDWEDDMKKKQSRGEAYKSSQRVDLKGSVVFQDEKEEKEHVVRVKVAGKDYSILINGNPRAAQAINGLLNPDANVGPVGSWVGKLRRGMSSLLTSFSPLFWVANYQRDLLSSFMRTSESEGWGDAFKYLANRRKAWRVASYIYKYENGELGNSYYENLYKEFAENGGITGYTVLTTNKEYEKLLADYAENVDKKFLNAIKGLWDKFMAFGEAIEQVSRFAAYITARESGKSIEEAVNAAKEVSVNFNRKGSAKPISMDELDKLRTKNGKKLNAAQKRAVIIFSAMPKRMKELYFFFNASVQALSSSAKLAKKSPGKAATWAGLYFGTSIAMAMINYLLAGDDDEEYLDLPDYLRHSTLLIKVSDDYYFKWSLPQEMRPFYAWADLLVSKAMGKMPHKNLGKEMALVAAQWLPVNPFDAEDPLLGLVPDYASPIAEAMANKTSFGGRIYDDMKFKSEAQREEIPAYRKATEKTGKIYVDLAELLNDISGGDEVVKGGININPSVVEHLVEGYGGGIYDFAKMVVALPGIIASDDPVEIKNIPFVNKVIMSVDETNMNSHVNDAFRYYSGIADNAKRVEKEYRESDDPSRADAYRNEEDWRIYLLYKQYEQDFKDVKEKLDNAVDKEEEDLLKQEQNVLREMFLDDIAKGDIPEVTFQIREDVKRFDKEIKAIMKPVTEANKERLERKNAGDIDGMLKAIERRDSLKDTPEYKRAEELNADLKVIKQQLKELGTVTKGIQRDSVVGELQKNYDALVRKMMK